MIHPLRDDNGYRNDTYQDIQTLELVKFLRNLGISIDDAKYDAFILGYKVKNIIDDDHVLYAFKNGINLTDYTQSQNAML